MKFDASRVGDDWVIEGMDHLRLVYGLKSDFALADVLSSTPGMLNVVRGRRTKPSTKLKFNLIGKLGWLSTAEEVAWAVSQVVGGDVGEALKSILLGLYATEKAYTQEACNVRPSHDYQLGAGASQKDRVLAWCDQNRCMLDGLSPEAIVLAWIESSNKA